MCIAIYKPAGKTISRSRLRRCWDRNPDGGGFALPDGKGGITVHKAMTWDEFDQAWSKDAYSDQPMVIHFRMATHGKVNTHNCHPHRVHDDLVVAHNGIIEAMTPYATEQDSDTVAFVNRVLADIPTPDIFTDGMTEMLDAFIGSSKLVFLDGSGRVSIVGESKGLWDGGIWYSNTSYRRPRVRPSGGYGTRSASTWQRTNWQQARTVVSEEEQLRAKAQELFTKNGTDLETWPLSDLQLLQAAYA